MTHVLLILIYIAFISLGLPDALLGAAWPTIYPDFNVPVSYAGIISMIIAAGTIVSSVCSDRLTFHLGTGKVTAFSVATTAVALLGFSFTHSFWGLCFWAVPYGLGAGSVDASLNNYVALHYQSRHMSWLHCFWGLGATVGPYVIGLVLTVGDSWNRGYRYIGIAQVVLSAILLCSLPIWKGRAVQEETVQREKALSLREILNIKGAKEGMLCFFAYCGLEQTAALWACSYLSIYKGVSADTVARFGSMFFIGITVGRAVSGFVTMKLSDQQMIRLGEGIIAVGLLAMLLPVGVNASLLGLVLIGLGCAPIYPCIIHSTPRHFGADRSQAVIGVQMASAYCGSCLAPPLFGALGKQFSMALFSWYMVLFLLLMVIMHERLEKMTVKQ